MYFEAAQPALLYLVPAVLLASMVVGAVHGEIGRLLRYSDDEYTGVQSGGRRYSVTVMPDVPGGSGGPVDDALPEDEDTDDASSPSQSGGAPAASLAGAAPRVSDSETPAASTGGATEDGGARRRSRRLQHQA